MMVRTEVVDPNQGTATRAKSVGLQRPSELSLLWTISPLPDIGWLPGTVNLLDLLFPGRRASPENSPEIRSLALVV